MDLVDARAFGPDALSTECVALSAPAYYFLFKLAHVGLASANALLAAEQGKHKACPPNHDSDPDPSDSDSGSDSASDSGSDSNSDSNLHRDAFARYRNVPRRWPRRWATPLPQHAAFFKHVFMTWGPRDDGLLACASATLPLAPPLSAPLSAPLPLPLPLQRYRDDPRLQLRVRLDDRGVPSRLAPFLEAPLARSVFLDVARFYSSLTCRVAASLVVPVTFDPACAPRLYRVSGATAGSRAVEPLAHHDGQLAALWDLRGGHAQLRAWDLPPSLRGHVGAWAFVCPARAAGRRAALVCCPFYADAGFVHGDWASGRLPGLLWQLCKRGARVALDAVDTVVLPWLPVMSARSRVPALEGLAHSRGFGTGAGAGPGPEKREGMGHVHGAAVVDTASLRVTLAWSAESAESAEPRAEPSRGSCRRSPRRNSRQRNEGTLTPARRERAPPLALPEALGIAFIVVLLAERHAQGDGTNESEKESSEDVLACVLAPGHILGRTAASAATVAVAAVASVASAAAPAPRTTLASSVSSSASPAPIASISLRSFIPWGRQ